MDGLDLQFELQGEVFEVCGDRSVFWRASSTLILSDVHLGKSSTFWSFGVAVPDDLESTLGRLDCLLRHTKAERILVLGDLVHSPAGLTDPVVERVATWRHQHESVAFDVVPGNHDRHSLDVLNDWAMNRLQHQHDEAGFSFVHDPEHAPQTMTWCGHLHPKVVVGRGPDAVSVPCLAVSKTRVLLPSFTEFSSGSRIPLKGSIWGFVEGSAIRLGR